MIRMAKSGWRGRTMVQITPDENLSKIVGSEPLKSHELIRELWKYIKKNCKTEKVKV